MKFRTILSLSCPFVCLLLIASCQTVPESRTDLTISKTDYQDKLQGFWLGQCIANWTGLITEMDKIGNIGEVQTGAFYTREDWGQPDQPNIWSEEPSDLSPTIDFYLNPEQDIWGADDDTDIEYMYQHLLAHSDSLILRPEQIRDGWLKHIRAEEENYLWVSNQRAFDLMQEGNIPPQTSNPDLNPDYEMIDAQLTTELFGLFAPGHPETARRLSHLPIRVTAGGEAAAISEFYVTMYSLAYDLDVNSALGPQLLQRANQASEVLEEGSYSLAMYQYVNGLHEAGITWEAARDSVYQRYQVEQQDGYDMTSRGIFCNACFAAGINYAASLISLFWGEGDLKETIKIGTLCGWDSDNPTATWGGMLGFVLGRKGVEKAFEREFPSQFNIHRTRQNFPRNGLDTFERMASEGVEITDRVVVEMLGGTIDQENNTWVIPVSL